MKKTAIPKQNKDLRRYVLRRKWMRVLWFLLWVTVLIVGALSYNNAHQTYPPERRILGWKLALWIAAAVVSGFFLFRLYRFFTDRTFCGYIERSALSHSYSSSADPGEAASYDFRLNTSLILRTDVGKRKRIRFEQKPGFYLYYHEGTYVCHLEGLPYPVCDPSRRTLPEGITEKDADAAGYLCAACGMINPELARPCASCGHSLIDPEKLWRGGADDFEY